MEFASFIVDSLVSVFIAFAITLPVCRVPVTSRLLISAFGISYRHSHVTKTPIVVIIFC